MSASLICPGEAGNAGGLRMRGDKRKTVHRLLGMNDLPFPRLYDGMAQLGQWHPEGEGLNEVGYLMIMRGAQTQILPVNLEVLGNPTRRDSLWGR